MGRYGPDGRCGRTGQPLVKLMTSFGYEATEDSIWIRMSAHDRQVRLDRANAEADLLGLSS